MSIIFLVVAVALVIGGFTMVGMSKQMAATQGVEILGEMTPETGEYVYTYEYDTDSIGKITIDIENAEINIIGGAEKPYVELINFASGMYEFSSSNRNLMVSDNSDFSTLSGIASAAMNFKGLRGLVNLYNMYGLEKTVNIYLCDDKPVKVMDCRLENGTVTIRDAKIATDYNVEIENGDLILSGISTKSALNVIIENGNVEIDDSLINMVNIDIENGSVDATGTIYKIEAEIENGDFAFGTKRGAVGYNMELSASNGEITVDDKNYGSFVTYSNRPTSDLAQIKVENGDINLYTIKE